MKFGDLKQKQRLIAKCKKPYCSAQRDTQSRLQRIYIVPGWACVAILEAQKDDFIASTMFAGGLCDFLI